MSGPTILWNLTIYLFTWKYKKKYYMKVSFLEIYFIISMLIELWVKVEGINMTKKDNKIQWNNTRNLLNISRKFRTLHSQEISLLLHNKTETKPYINSLLNSHRKTIYTRRDNTKITFNDFSNDNNNIYDRNRDIFNTNNNKDTKEFSSSWAIRLPKRFHDLDSTDFLINDIIKKLNLYNHGNIGYLPGHFLLVHQSFYNHTAEVSKDLYDLREQITNEIKNHPHIEWVEHQIVRKRYKRTLEFQDQFFPSQWHLVRIFCYQLFFTQYFLNVWIFF